MHFSFPLLVQRVRTLLDKLFCWLRVFLCYKLKRLPEKNNAIVLKSESLLTPDGGCPV